MNGYPPGASRRRRFAHIGVLACGLAVIACSNLTRYEPQTYVVRSGDTLYSIAWRHGLDHRELARWNGLTDPNRIAVGQRLALSPTAGAPSRPAGAAVARTTRRDAAPARADDAAPTFGWPVEGAVASRFGQTGVLSTGIGIAGQLGQAIVAAAPGRVVYAGSGLPDYGQLVIIEHNERWLTAYGHNQRLVVGQGDQVSRGQKIGEMGLGPSRDARVYFEIRRDGEPLDPLAFLNPAAR